MIIWRGLGWIVAVIVFGFSLFANFLFNGMFGNGYYDRHNWPFSVSLLASAMACWVLGNKLKSRPDRIVIDKETGKEMALNQSQNDFFFLPMQYWGPVLAIIAILALFR